MNAAASSISIANGSSGWWCMDIQNLIQDKLCSGNEAGNALEMHQKEPDPHGQPKDQGWKITPQSISAPEHE